MCSLASLEPLTSLPLRLGEVFLVRLGLRLGLARVRLGLGIFYKVKKFFFNKKN
jgi:hypothetical protein